MIIQPFNSGLLKNLSNLFAGNITFVTIEVPYELTKLFCERAERENYGIYFFKISALHIYILTLQA